MHPYLFLLFFFFGFSTLAEEEKASASSFQPGWGSCSESYLKNICGGEVSQASEKNKNSGQKMCSDREARKCCGDPTTCLGGEALSTFNEINNIVTQVGPGLASMLQGFGKDMSNMCETMQGLAASGASVALAAATKCKSSISSCNSNCDYQIKKVECDKYIAARNTCSSNKGTCMPKPSCTNTHETAFQQKVLPIFKQVRRHEETQASCLAQKAKAKEISKAIPQMANSAISAELCKQQARMTQDKAGCEKQKGHTWRDGKCHPPEEEEEPTVAFDIQSGKNIISHSTGSLGTPTVEAPNPETTTEDDPDGDSRTSGGGGGGTRRAAGGSSPDGIDLPDPSSPYSEDSEEESDSTASTGTDKGRGSSGLRRGGFGGYGSRGGYYGKKRKPYSSSGKDNDLSMGGGGFGGYGGGGFSSRGSPSSQASLGLSQKKLKEMEAKKGAKRATAGEAGGGAHQSIFERVTKRFQILCQDKLDCQ
ncbi:MAG: hypothetical protein OXM55_05785 [Bdellovibrionales bacterium]|nr:hypothetical protein [Bdellovibrionales bacterium]